MKFLATASAFLAATSWAAPLEERQAPTVVSTIDTSLTALAAVLPQYEVAINQAAATILSSTSVTAEAEVAAEAIIRTNLDAITSSINATIATVVQATGAATGTVITAASGLTQAEIDMLTNDLVIIVGILTNLNATVTAVANVEAAAGILFGGEITALQRVIQPFLSPILVFAQAVYSVSVGVTVSGLANAVVGVYTILGNLESSIGLADLH